MSSSKNFKHLLKIFLINIAVFLALGLTIELATRIGISFLWKETAYLKYGFKYPRINFSHIGPLYHEDKGTYLAFRHMRHANVSWAGADGVVEINKYGFRGKDFEIKKPRDVYRIITMGESSTFGFHVSDNNTWPFLLNQYLENKRIEGKKIEVINLGLPWYNSEDNLNLLNFALTLSPDLVFYYGAANDIVDLYLPKIMQENQSKIAWYLSKIENYSLFLYKARIFVQTRLNSKITSIQSEGLDTYISSLKLTGDAANSLFISPFEKNMKIFNHILANNNSKFVLIKQIRSPLGREWIRRKKSLNEFNQKLEEIQNAIDNMNFYSYYAYIDKKIRINNQLNLIESVQFMHSKLIFHLDFFAKENDIELIDFIASINGDFNLLTTDLHLTEQGNKELAKILHNYLMHQNANINF